MKILEKYKFRKKDVAYGWGEDVEAIEFPVKLARECLRRIDLLNSIDVKFSILHDNCRDVLNNYKRKEITYIIAPFWADLISIADEL